MRTSCAVAGLANSAAAANAMRIENARCMTFPRSVRVLGRASAGEARACRRERQVSRSESSAQFELRVRPVGERVAREHHFAHPRTLHLALQAARNLRDG